MADFIELEYFNLFGWYANQGLPYVTWHLSTKRCKTAHLPCSLST